MRTACVRDLVKNTCSITSESENIQPVSTYTQTSLTLANFLESPEEIREQKVCKTSTLAYVFQTYLLHQQCEGNVEKSLSDMRHFLNEKPSGAMNSQVSKIHYMELVNKHPDSDETMALVAEELPYLLG